MSVKSGIFAALAALALAGTTLALTTTADAQPAKPHASSACGSSCTTISNESDGSGWATEAAGTTGVGEGIYIASATNNTADDFKLLYEGTVEQFYEDGIVNSVVGENWPTDSVYEYEYAPGGTDSGLCIGETSLGGALTLQSCGVSAVTCWIPLSNDELGGYEPLMIATNTVVNTPYVMTAPGVFSSVTTAEMTLTTGTFSPDQMMRDLNGVL